MKTDINKVVEGDTEPSGIGIFVDFGSTYTKAVALDLDEEKIIGQGRAGSTVTTDITKGLKSALQEMEAGFQESLIGKSSIKMACSSAAGGLRLAVIGLVPNLSVKAGRLSALGAGAKLVGNYSFKLNQGEISRIEQLKPDIILLVGGTDGGNEEVILHNAQMIAKSEIEAPVIVAGNKVCADELKSILASDGRYVKVVDNVLGVLDKLNVGPSRAAIREIFMDRIVHAKGLHRANRLVDRVIMPTPLAVLRAAEILSVGAGKEKGLGELIVVDIGGATTDVHSVAQGLPRDQSVGVRGIPEPFAKRTVEGDLGIRYNAMSILETIGEARIEKYGGRWGSRDELESKVKYLSEHTKTVPIEEEDFLLDNFLARRASEIAVERHAGHLEQIYSPYGPVLIQSGKDLREVRNLIGTGGIFAYGREPLTVLEGALFSPDDHFSLRPQSPEFLIDSRYILYAVGLLAERAPEKAMRIGKKYLEKVSG
jgi:uncharacterized protein (TIGR01319 family)